MLTKIISACRLYFRRRKFRVGAIISRFIAPDIRRDIEVVDASEVDLGFVKAKIRTWNVLYASKGIVATPAFTAPLRIRIDHMWDWNGPSWGGVVPPGEPKGK